MARWYLTGDDGAAGRARSVCEAAGLESSGARSGPGYEVRAYEKRAVDAPNFVEFDGGDWICSAGTVVHDGRLGKPPLREMHRRLSAGGVAEARSGVFGHYAVAAKHGDSVTVFTDPQGTFQLYYTADGPPLVVSNSLHVVAECLGSPTVNPIRLIEDAFQTATGVDTFYDGVKRLFGSQVLRLDLPDGGVSVVEQPTPPRDLLADVSSVTDAVERYRSEVREVFAELVGIEPIALNATGGLDTRTILAALLDQGISPDLIYGVGNSGLTNTKRSDLEVGQELAETLGLSHYRMDWSDDHPHDRETLEELFERYGFQFAMYGTPRRMLEELEGGISPYPRLQLGGYTPAFTNKKVWERDGEAFSFEALVDDYVHDAVDDEAFECEEAYREDVAGEVRTALEHAPVEFPEEGASLETFVRARLFLRIPNDGYFVNFVNEFSYYLAPFLLKRLYDPLVTVPTSYRQDDEFQVRLAHGLHPEVFDAPVFSGLRPARIDLETFRMRRTPRQRARGLVGELLPSAVKPLARQAYQAVKSDDPDDRAGIDDRIREENARYVMENPLTGRCFSSVPENIDLPYLNNLHRYVFGVEEIGNAEEDASGR